MTLYHGTNCIDDILNNDLRIGTWLSADLSHAFRLACRRERQRGGDARVVELEIPAECVYRVKGRSLPTYKYTGGSCLVIAVHQMSRTQIQ